MAREERAAKVTRPAVLGALPGAPGLKSRVEIWAALVPSHTLPKEYPDGL